MSELKDGVSLQMALIQLRWQQLRQLELDEAQDVVSVDSHPAVFAKEKFESLYSPA